MKKAFFPLIMVAVLAACASPTGVVETQPSSSEQVGTVVAMTLQALMPTVTETAETPTAAPDAATSLLPHSLYFLGRDSQSLTQVYRMEHDGKTLTQLTFEPVNVTDYDVSLVDGSIAYVASNQLLLANADGSNRRMLVDGGTGPDLRGFYRPVFSPDGGTLAYADRGLNLYSVSTGVSKLVIENQYGDPLPSGALFPLEIYMPERYSPDGTKLLLALGHWEVAPSHAVYYLDINTLVRYEEVQDYIYCCSFHGGPVWSPDSSSFYGVASVHDTAYQFGELWRVNAANGALTRTFNSPLAGSETVSLPVEPYPAPDGQLYFFFGAYDVDSGFFDAPELKLVRSDPDGVTTRTVLRDENFVLMDEALWAPDASFVIVAIDTARSWDVDGGVLELYYTDRTKEPVWLAPYGQQLKWGL
jgi:hypothetical protein